MTLARKLELIGAAVVLLICLIFLYSWIGEREARARYEMEAKVRAEEQAKSAGQVKAFQSQLQTVLASLEAQKQQVVRQPQQAPQIIHDLIPTPIQQTAQITPQTPQDAIVATLTKQNEVELAQFALGCKQCSEERQSLKLQMAEKDKIIDSQGIELRAAKVAIKGGTKMQRVVTAIKWIGLGLAIGYGVHR